MCVTDLFPDTFALSCVRELLVCFCYFYQFLCLILERNLIHLGFKLLGGVTSLVTRKVQDEWKCEVSCSKIKNFKTAVAEQYTKYGVLLTIAHMLMTSSAVTTVYRLVLNSCIKTEINFLKIFQMFCIFMNLNSEMHIPKHLKNQIFQFLL